ncbi:MAG TPA: hypothetical protein VKF84_07365 [Candidatus Sulfotelmatobacter sp.]|nr:hypothetical protein [Candidatus Sulfotelmatobacter sp.]
MSPYRTLSSLLACVVAILALASCDDNQAPTSAPVTSQTQAPLPSAIPAAARVEVPIPANEKEFILAVQQGQAAFRSAPNEMAQGGTRSERRIAICQSLRQISVSDWVGRIDTLSSNSDGKGVLEISLAPDIRVKTWNNDFSDHASHTLIDPSSSLFGTVSRMRRGDQVVFSGAFFPSDVDCVTETSMSLEGSMTDPEFLFRFLSVNMPSTK